jgi:hypothetical protein
MFVFVCDIGLLGGRLVFIVEEVLNTLDILFKRLQMNCKSLPAEFHDLLPHRLEISLLGS